MARPHLSLGLLALLAACGPRLVFAPAPAEVSTEQQSACARFELGDGTEPPIEPYWSPGTFDAKSDELLRTWFSNRLCAMGEAPLRPSSEQRTTIRLLWLRSFHAPIAVRVDREDGVATVTAIRLDRKDEGPWVVGARHSAELSDATWGRIARGLRSISFWDLPAEGPAGGLDGSRFVLEVVDTERHHVVVRWGPAELERFGRLLLDLSGFEIEPFY